MTIVFLRTDNQTAEVALFDDGNELAAEVWQAHRVLSDTLHTKLQAVLDKAQKTLQEIEGVVVFQGPGSFTGLRIGIAVANSLAYANNIPIVGTSGADWKTTGLARHANGDTQRYVQPDYGRAARTTRQKK